MSQYNWFYIKGLHRGEIRDHPALTEADYMHKYFDDCLRETDEGWLHVELGGGYWAASELGEELSKPGVEVLLFCAEDTAMTSIAAHYKDGQKLWGMVHIGSDGDPYDLEVTGAPPAIFEQMAQDCFARQRADVLNRGPRSYGVDYVWSLPEDLIRALVGDR